MSDKGIPRRDGKGYRVNKNRGGCEIPRLNRNRLMNRRPRRGWREVRKR